MNRARRREQQFACWWYFGVLKTLLMRLPSPVVHTPALVLACVRFFVDPVAQRFCRPLGEALDPSLSRWGRLRLRWRHCYEHERYRLLVLQADRLSVEWARAQVRGEINLPPDGAILVTPHHTAMRLGVIALTGAGYRIGGGTIDPGDTEDLAALDPWTREYYRHLRALRSLMYGPRVFRQHDVGRRGLRLLQEGGYLLLQGDGFALDWHPGPLLRRSVPIPSGPVWFAAHSGKPVIPFAVIPEKRGWRLWFGDPIPPDQITHDATARALESCIRRAPASWERSLALAWSHAPHWDSSDDRRDRGSLLSPAWEMDNEAIEPPQRIEALIDRFARERPDNVALIFAERRWTFAELRAELDRRAAVLIEAGMVPGDVLLTTESVTDDVAITFLACCRADIPLLYLSPQLAPTELQPLVTHAGPKVVLTADGLPHPVVPVLPALPLSLPGKPDARAFAEAAQRSASGSPDATACIQTTSGTTAGVGKLICMPHRMVTWRTSVHSWWETPGEVYCIPRPTLFAVRGFCEMLFTGGTVLLSVTTHADQLEHEMAVHGVTALWTVPSILQLLIAQKRSPPDRLALRVVRTSAAPLPVEVRRAAEHRYGATVIHEYASTEGGSITTAPREGAPDESIGKVYPGIAARIVDEHDADVPAGETGMLLLRSPGLMTGYLDDPATTAATLRNGWLRTGDLARCDANGFLLLEGRSVLRINVRGFKVAPEEVEAVLEQHPDVSTVAVTAHTGRYGDVVRAVIVPKAGRPRIRDLRRHSRERLAGYKVPRRWEFREELPRSPLGKVLRSQL